MTTTTALAALLKNCAQQKDLHKGSSLHAAVLKKKLLRDNILIGNALVNMYAKCGALAKAQQVFDDLPNRDIVSWTSLIAAYAQGGHGKLALKCFRRMQCEAVSPDAVTFSCILKACGSGGAAEKGKETHAEIVGEELLGTDTVLGNALVDMYAKCGALTNAQRVFDELPIRDVVSWTALIVGYCQHGHCATALECFEQMQREGLSPNALTFSCALKACGSIGAIDKGREIHVKILKERLLEKNSVLGTALLDMYIKCGALVKAREVFDELVVRDKVSWTALIAGYCQRGRGEEAINSFEQMQSEGLYADIMTLGSVLQACGSIGAAEKGSKIHAEILREGWLDKDIVLGNALVDMYAKCGTSAKAQQVFDELPARDAASWTALMAGYAQVGKHEIVFESFNKLMRQGIEPDLVLFNIVLNACRYYGLVDEGQTYFETLCTSFRIIPTLELYASMVDLFGRAGHIEKAMAVIRKMPSSDYLPVWFALLGACRKWGNMKTGRLAFEHAVRLDSKCAVVYVCMINIYAAAGMPGAAKKIEAMRKEATHRCRQHDRSMMLQGLSVNIGEKMFDD